MDGPSDGAAGPGPSRLPPRNVLILAGEASGDAHGAGVAREMRRRWPRVALAGTGGPRMAAEGVLLLEELEQLAVMGFAEVARKLGFFRRLEARIRRRLVRGRTDLVVPVDYPGLNMRTASAAAAAGVPVLYYVGPQVWAWKPGRAKRLARIADRIALILPFEPPIYEAHGGRAVFVGHPLLDKENADGDSEDLARRLKIGRDCPVLALFPGSRLQEIERHQQPFTATARELERRAPGLRTVVCRAPSMPARAYRRYPFPLTRDGASLRALAAAGLVKSGTSTLEAALAGMPFVTAYVTHPATWLLARRLVRVPHVALANLVAGKRVVPEFLQSDASPRAMASALRPLLDESSAERRSMLAGLASVRTALGGPGAARRVVDLAEEILRERSGAASFAAGRVA